MKYFHRVCLITPLILFTGIVIASTPGKVGKQNGINHAASDTSNWQGQSTGVAGGMINSVSAVDRNVCWLAGSAGKILRTVNEGTTWSLVKSGIIDTQDVHVIEGVSDSVAFAGTTPSESTYIYRTTDGGSSWAKVFSQHGGFIDWIRMFNPTNGIAVGEPVGGFWTIIKTSNGGTSWLSISSVPPQINGAIGGNSFGALDSTYVWFFVGGRSYWSNDGGESWGYNPDSSTSASGAWVEWWNESRVALFVGTHGVYYYDHFGYTRRIEPPGMFIPPTALVGALGTTSFWLLQAGEVFYTPDGGSTWTDGAPSGLNMPTTSIDMVTLGSDVAAWAVGIGDTVYHYHQLLTGVDEHRHTMPAEFSLDQNFPNPFNPSTIISFKLPVSSFVSLKVYDLLGQEIATLAEGVIQPGVHNVRWSAAGFASGVYLYRLKAGSFTETKKLLLIR
jgi:photosystem II stability/assembly factor-like uncharacterized protein